MSGGVDTVTQDYAPNQIDFQYQGALGPLVRLSLANTILTFVTLGVYRFWAKTKIRGFLWHNTTLDGRPFVFTGTGGELFKAFLFVFFLVYVPIMGAFAVINAFFPILGMVVLYLALPFMIYFATYAARRYLMSRTMWSGIRFVQLGTAREYALLAYGMLLLRMLTYGVLAPKADLATYGYRVNNLRFGHARFSFDGDWKHLLNLNIITLVLFPFTFGLSRFWYSAALLDYQLSRTIIHGISMQSTLSPGKMIRFFFGNLMIMLGVFAVTALLCFLVAKGFGWMSYTETSTAAADLLLALYVILFVAFFVTSFVAAPLLTHRHMVYLTSHVHFVGDVDISDVLNIAEHGDGTGEEIADVLDVDGLGGAEFAL